MEFTKSLLKGKLIKRYKRFFVDVKLNKEIVTAHCPNTGSMKGLLDSENDVYLQSNNDPKRKLKYGLQIIKAKKNLVGVNTHLANKIVLHGLNNNLIKELKNNNSIINGLRIVEMQNTGPLFEKGIKVDDIIISINEENANWNNLISSLKFATLGENLKLDLITRNGELISINFDSLGKNSN